MTEEAKKLVPLGGNAPYKAVKQGGKWVVKNNVGDVKATYPGDDAGYAKALLYLKALYASVPGAGDRADKVKFTGTARRRGPAYKPKSKQKASDMTLAERMAAQYGDTGMQSHKFLAGSTGDCMACGKPEVNPAHDSWGDDPELDMSEGLLGNSLPLAEPAAYAGSGCMVALFLDDDQKGKFADPEDDTTEDPDDFHVTLAYMKESPTGTQLAALQATVAGVATQFGPLDGVWGGTGLFNPSKGSDGKPVAVALPDLPQLPELRNELVRRLDGAGFPVSKDHGYTPHMTVAYAAKEGIKAKGKLSFDTITLDVGGKRYEYPLGPKTATEPASEQVEELVEEAHDAKPQKKHRFVGAHHLRDHVVKTAGFFGGCYACGGAHSDPDHDGDVDQPGVADSDAGGAPATTASVEASAAAVEDQKTRDIQRLAAGIDAGVDQALVLLRSVGVAGLPPYAEQARDLLGAVEPACDELLEALGVSDPDDASPEAAKLSPADQKSVDAESERIKENKKTPAAQKAHKFRPAVWTHPNGHPRCMVCGDEEPMGGQCNAAEKSATMTTERVPQVEDAPLILPATRAFLTELNGRTLLTAPANTFVPEWERALSPNEHFTWMQGRFVGAEEANRNGAFWSNADLEIGEPTVKHGPLNWLHEDRHIIGTIADAKLVSPTSEAAAAGQGKHIAAVAAIWSWLYPDESYVIESASDAGSLYYSMECISQEVACVGANGCGMSFPYQQTVTKPDTVCEHIRQRSAHRRMVNPTFLGGAAIVPPVRPGWGEANAQVMRQAAQLAERAFVAAGEPDMPASQWEALMASVVMYAGR